MEKQMQALMGEAARNEGKIEGKDFLAEIKVLLDDYFEGEFTCGEGSICCRLFNGQTIRLVAEEE